MCQGSQVLSTATVQLPESTETANQAYRGRKFLTIPSTRGTDQYTTTFPSQAFRFQRARARTERERHKFEQIKYLQIA